MTRHNVTIINPDLSKKHEKYKYLFRDEFNKLIQSNLVKQVIAILSLESFNFEIISSELQQIKQLCESISNANSSQIAGFSAAHTIFEFTKEDLTPFLYPIFKYYAEFLGRCIVCKDKCGNIVASMALIDILDVNNNNTSDKFLLPLNLQHAFEVQEFVETNCIAKYKKKAKYGEYSQGKWLHVDPHYRNSGLSLILRYMTSYMNFRLGYKYFVGVMGNRLTRKHIVGVVEESKVYDFSSFTFKDSTRIQYYFDKFQKNHNYNNQQMMNLRQNCKFMAFKRRPTDPNQSGQIFIEASQKYRMYQKNRKQISKL